MSKVPYAENTRRSTEELSNISIDDDDDDDVIDGSNIFSDPESEWGMEKSKDNQTSLSLIPSTDSRPEVDQPSLLVD